MTDTQWLLIAILAIGAYSIRFVGLVCGQIVSQNAGLNKFLGDLPGSLIVALVASSLSDANALTWVAAALALIVAVISNNVVATMGLGFISIFTLKLFFT
ncbi:MAG: AzlD domain-containing protein [Sneathiella sp.]